jgi:proline iminopeptidase
MREKTRILTLKNGYHIWTHTQNLGAKHKLLVLHGGPGDTHEVYERFGAELADLDIEVTMYDQLGSWYSDTPNWDDPAERERFLNEDYYLGEVEEIRQLLGYDEFYLAGHSWGGLLTMMYTHRHQTEGHLKGAIIISMIDNIKDYVDRMKWIRNEEFTPAENAFLNDIEARGEWENEEYQAKIRYLYTQYINRRQPKVMHHQVDIQAKPVYNFFQGDNEFVIVGELDNFDFSKEISEITLPTLLTFADHETMPLATAERMADSMSNARLVVTPDGGHNHMVDNPQVFFANLRHYFEDVFNGTFPAAN